METYRFDDAYQKVYEYDQAARTYVFIGTYWAYSIVPDMEDQDKANAVENDKMYSVFSCE